MKVKGIQCPHCKDLIWSRHQHDWRQCKCKACFIDGGQKSYIRLGYPSGEEAPKIIEFEVIE